MKARDAMDPEFVGTYDCQGLEALLLAQTPAGEGVYIAPDGTLMRVRPHYLYESLYVFVPIEEATE